VVNPRAFRELFPELADQDFPFRRPVEGEEVRFLTRRRAFRIPTPPTMRNHGNYIASLSEMVRWLGARAEALGVSLFAGFPAEALLVEGSRVCGVRTTPRWIDRAATPGESRSRRSSARPSPSWRKEFSALAQAWLTWQGIEP
jgi:electron-transferring-flavoprotein dehydrogenase